MVGERPGETEGGAGSFSASPEPIAGDSLDEGLAPAARLYGLGPEAGTDALKAAVQTDPQTILDAYSEEYRLARTDPKTELLNQRAFEERFLRLGPDGLVRARVMALLLLDIDHFKRLNDKAGYEQGDELIKAVAAKLRGTDEVFRFGGDEFAVVLHDDEPRGESEVSIEARLAAVEKRLHTEVKDVFSGEDFSGYGLDVSIGSVALTSTLGRKSTPQDMVAAANTALKYVKGRNREESYRQYSLYVRICRWVGRTAYRLSGDFDSRLAP
jgi:diguanylate cyclase (GGDEF)-like protein